MGNNPMVSATVAVAVSVERHTGGLRNVKNRLGFQILFRAFLSGVISNEIRILNHDRWYGQ